MKPGFDIRHRGYTYPQCIAIVVINWKFNFSADKVDHVGCIDTEMIGNHLMDGSTVAIFHVKNKL